MADTPQEQNESGKKVANSLVAVSVAVVVAVYTAGYTRTRAGVRPNPSPATPPQTAVSSSSPSTSKWKDGAYFGRGTSPHGDIEATVVVKGGRIESARISQCLTRYSCSVIGELIAQVAQRQSPEVDYVSGATESTNAFYYALVEALTKATISHETGG